MWDAIKKAAGAVLEWGEAMLRHTAAVEQILSARSVEASWQALHQYVVGIESEAEFQRFMQVVVHQIGLAEQALEQARASESSSWGNTFEDRIAYQAAHINAGVPRGSSAQAQAAEARLGALVGIRQAADHIWAEASQAKAPPGAG